MDILLLTGLFGNLKKDRAEGKSGPTPQITPLENLAILNVLFTLLPGLT